MNNMLLKQKKMKLLYEFGVSPLHARIRFMKFIMKIAELDEELIRRCGTILNVINTGYAIDVEKFREYTFATAKLYVDKYKWHKMSVTVYKVLMHGADIAKSASLQISALTEEAQEHRYKDMKRFRESNCMKTDRKRTYTDLAHKNS